MNQPDDEDKEILQLNDILNQELQLTLIHLTKKLYDGLYTVFMYLIFSYLHIIVIYLLISSSFCLLIYVSHNWFLLLISFPMNSTKN